MDNSWREKSNADGLVTYLKSGKKRLLMVGFNQKNGDITIEEYVLARRRWEEWDKFYPTAPPHIRLEELEWITAKAKELFIGICFKGENK